jgi:hypothetical protein
VTGAAIDLRDAPPQFRLAAAAVAAMPTELRRELGKSVRREIVPVAIRAYSQYAGAASTGNRLPFDLIRSMKVTARAGIVTGFRFGSNRRLSGGGTLADLARPIEFGSSGRTVTTYSRRSRKGNAHTVTRKGATAFTPRRADGRVIWPATYDVVAPRVLALWIGLVDDLVRDGWE